MHAFLMNRTRNMPSHIKQAYADGFALMMEKWSVFGEPRTDNKGKQFPPEAYITPDNPVYDPTKSHYDAAGNWVGDITAAEAAAYWKTRSLDFLPQPKKQRRSLLSLLGLR